MRMLALLVAALAACSSPTDTFDHTLDLRVDGSVVIAGQDVTITVVNASASTIWFDHCRTELQRAGASGWVPVQDRDCSGDAQPIAAGTSASFAWTLDPDLEPGQHRFVAIVELPSASGRFDRQIQTSTFEIITG